MNSELAICSYSSRQLLDVLASRCEAMVFAAYGMPDETNVESKAMCAGSGPLVLCKGLVRALSEYVDDRPLQLAVHWTIPRLPELPKDSNDGE